MTIQINLQMPEHIQLMLLSDGIRELNREKMSVTGSPAVLVSKSEELCSVDGSGGLIDLTVDAFAALIRSNCVPGKYKKPSNEEREEAEKGGYEPEATFIEEPSLPRPLVRAYMEQRVWDDIPRVQQIARAPIVRPDFTVRWEPGWDEATSCWVTRGIKPDTTLVDGKFDIRRVFSCFPFSDRRLVADALAAAFTPLLSTAISTALPGLIVSARKPGSGKTELAKFCSILGNGGKTFTTWKGAGELEKMIGTYVAEDSRVVIFDNIKNDIDSTAMESVITARAVSFRKMYSHTSSSLRSNTSWFMTANGAVVSPDMVRRSIVIMLDKENTPGLVPWSGSIPATVEGMESQLVTLMCHLIDNWREAGCVPGSVTFSNFEEWSRVVSGILEHAGIGGMFEAREEVVGDAIQTDDEDDMPVLEAIAWCMGEDEWLAGDLWETVNDPMDFGEVKTIYVRKWLESVSKVRKSASPGMPVGRALHSMVGKTFDGCNVKLTFRVGGGNKKYYKCVSLDGAPLDVRGEKSHGF